MALSWCSARSSVSVGVFFHVHLLLCHLGSRCMVLSPTPHSKAGFFIDECTISVVMSGAKAMDILFFSFEHISRFIIFID